MGELFGALGAAWPRLLLYPGGLVALGAAWLLERWLEHCARHRFAEVAPGTNIVALVAPLAALSLLPLAPARSFPYGLDLFTALALLEWPAAQAWRTASPTPRVLLERYGLLLLAALGMATGAGSFELSALLRQPEQWPARAALLAGAALWLAGLPRLLAWRGAAARLGALGLTLIGALPLLGALTPAAAQLPAGWGSWLLPPVAALGAALLLGGLLWLPLRVRRWIELALGTIVFALVIWHSYPR